MSIKELSIDQIESLVGTRHAVTGIEYPPNGLQPYYTWLVRALHLLAESSFGALRVQAADELGPAVWIAPGRASLSGVVLDFEGGSVDLSGYNNDTAYVWLYNNSGSPGVGVGADASGWPGVTHLKLAEVTLASGQITLIMDRRIEQVLSV